MLRSIGLGVTLYCFWLLLSAQLTPRLIGLGVVSCLLAVWVGHRMNAVDEEGLPFHIAFRFLLYVPWLIKEMVVANVALARIILDPKLPINPRYGRYPLPFRTSLGKVIYANSVTIVPGSVSVVVEDDHIEVHALTETAYVADPASELVRRVHRVKSTCGFWKCTYAGPGSCLACS